MQYIETQGPRKNTALTQTLWQLAYEATRTKLAAKLPVLWSSLTKRWLHQELNATGHAGQLGASVIAFLIGPFGFLRRGPDFDMALDSHGFVWHLLTFYISNLTSEASLWHSMLCPFTASMARGTWGSWTKMLDDVSESKREQKLCIVHDVNWCHVNPNP